MRGISGHFARGTDLNGQVLCWGNKNSYGLGNGNPSSSWQPVAGNHTWSKIDTGENRTCGLRTDGTLWCEGSSSQGQAGEYWIQPFASPVTL